MVLISMHWERKIAMSVGADRVVTDDNPVVSKSKGQVFWIVCHPMILDMDIF